MWDLDLGGEPHEGGGARSSHLRFQIERSTGAGVSREATIEDEGLVVPVVPGAWLPESAGEHIVTRVPLAKEEDRVQVVVDKIAGDGFEALEAVYVVDGDRRLVGAIRLP